MFVCMLSACKYDAPQNFACKPRPVMFDQPEDLMGTLFGSIGGWSKGRSMTSAPARQSLAVQWIHNPSECSSHPNPVRSFLSKLSISLAFSFNDVEFDATRTAGPASGFCTFLDQSSASHVAHSASDVHIIMASVVWSKHSFHSRSRQVTTGLAALQSISN